MKTKRFGYIALVISGMAFVSFMLSPLLFKTKDVQAQCLQYTMVSCAGGGCNCGVGFTKINEVQTGPCIGAYCAPTWTALCITSF